MTNAEHMLVLGLGNPLMGDDGLGLRALARLRREWAVDGAELVDGGTWGMNLLALIEESHRVLLIDAIDVGAEPGTLVTLERDQLPRLFARKLSPHETDLREVLALAELRGTFPEQVAAVGIQPGTVDLSTELTAPVASALEALLDLVVARLEASGLRCRRTAPPVPDASVLPGGRG
jgi:hydrogenase maturation protease